MTHPPQWIERASFDSDSEAREHADKLAAAKPGTVFRVRRGEREIYFTCVPQTQESDK